MKTRELALSEDEAKYVYRLELALDAPFLVTGGVAINYWCGGRHCRDLDIVAAAFAHERRWSDALLFPRPQVRPVSLELVRHSHEDKYGAGYCARLLRAVTEAELVEIHGQLVRVAPPDYLVYIKQVFAKLRDDPKDFMDLERLGRLGG